MYVYLVNLASREIVVVVFLLFSNSVHAWTSFAMSLYSSAISRTPLFMARVTVQSVLFRHTPCATGQNLCILYPQQTWVPPKHHNFTGKIDISLCKACSKLMVYPMQGTTWWLFLPKSDTGFFNPSDIPSGALWLIKVAFSGDDVLECFFNILQTVSWVSPSSWSVMQRRRNVLYSHDCRF